MDQKGGWPIVVKEVKHTRALHIQRWLKDRRWEQGGTAQMARTRGGVFLLLGLCFAPLAFVPSVPEEKAPPVPVARRSLWTGALLLASPANAQAPQKVLVAGATGQTGRRIVERLAKDGQTSVVGGVRDVSKAWTKGVRKALYSFERMK